MNHHSNVVKLDLQPGWTLSRGGEGEPFELDFPNDVHSVLLEYGAIEDPYWRETEKSLDWVHESVWVATRRFQMPDEIAGRYILTLDSVDCHAEVVLNGQKIGNLGNRFRRYELDVTKVVKEFENTLEIYFLSNSQMAKEKSSSFPISVPHTKNNRIPHYNFLRKPQCDAGWDWNIALSPLGVYGEISLRKVDPVLLKDITVRQHHQAGSVTVEVDLHVDAAEPVEADASISVDGQTDELRAVVYPGKRTLTLAIVIESPRLWWPVGHGSQELYDLYVQIGSESRRIRLGLRKIELNTEKDDTGSRFAILVNGREIFMRGANWVPADALPARNTPEKVADILDSAIDANMNMLRIWGGGTYEPDWFYQMCTEKGLLVWQDFMFACNLYPTSDRKWLDEVRIEAEQQVRRLSKHPCIALFCGDNELVGALTWYEDAIADRDRYLAMYERLNSALAEVVEDEATGVPWWSSSPSVGPLNFGDSWHDDTSGDMHFWDVWHSSKDFEHYRNVRPRFCSEFGFQSFPSPILIETFTEEHDRNVSSRVMDVHQRNQGGNSRIVETLARYFRFPDDFAEMTWLSQVSQGLAMKTAIEFWRASKPRCMGTLYWQLNDTWPVASWSSLEYGGAWKLVHYMARRFYEPVLLTAQPDETTGEIVVWAINDTSETVALSVVATRVDVQGPMNAVGDFACVCSPEQATEVARLAATDLQDQEFLYLQWQDIERRHVGENEYLHKRPKAYDLLEPNITVRHEDDQIILESDVPAFFVTYDHGGADILTDNCFTLLPNTPKVLTVKRKRHGPQAHGSLQWLKG